MLGHGTNTKTNFGWQSDSDGTPELFYWQGAVEHWRPYYYLWNGAWNFFWDYNRPAEKENKLYKLTFDHATRKVSRTLIWDGYADGSYQNDTNNIRYGNLTFISKDVFLITGSYMPENPNDAGSENDTYPRTVLYANKIEGPNASGEYTVTPKIWQRLILKEGANDSGNSNPNAARMDYPGKIIGLSFIPPESPDYDESSSMSNIIAMSCDFPNGGLWTQNTTNNGQDVRRMILRLSTDNEEISIPDYLADTEGWTGPSSEGGADGIGSGISAWKTIKDFGANDAGGYGANEGWCTLDNEGNLIYGDLMGYRSLSQVMSSRGHMSANEGGAGYRIQLPNGNVADDLGDDWKLYIHDVACVSAPLGSSVDINPDTNSGNHVACYFDAGFTYDFQNGLPANGFGFPTPDSGSTHISGNQIASGEIFEPVWNQNNSSEFAEVAGGMFHYNLNSVLHANGGCCDIYGETYWGENLRSQEVPYKNVILTITPRNQSRFLRDGSGYWSADTTYNREGITVFRREENTNQLKLLGIENSGTIENPVEPFKDHNGYRCLNYQFDGSWGEKYQVPCCLQDTGGCDDYQPECENGASFVAANPNPLPGYTVYEYDFDSVKTQMVAFNNLTASNVNSSSGTNGKIPSTPYPGRNWTTQEYYFPETGGLSFRPKWKL